MIGLLVMAYGGPNNIDEVEPYLMDVRGHRPTAPQVVDEVRERYRQIGGRSPILEQTQAQAAALQAALNADGHGNYRAFVGMRHWHPYIRNALSEMEAQGITRAVGIAMAPHYSRMSIGAYFKKIQEADSDVDVRGVQDWHLEPGYLDALAERVEAALARFPASRRPDIPVLFTAHSLPQRILEWKDPYPDQLHETVCAVMERLGERAHAFAFQSAAISSEPWLGPGADQAIQSFAADGRKELVLCPIGFVCEHVEILYDVDVVYQALAKSVGLQLERIEMLGTAPKMIEGLARLVRLKAEGAGWQ